MSRRRRLLDLARPWLERLGLPLLSRPALHGIDRRLANLLPYRGGYFVEAGANDGFSQSNTYYLERFRGWRGLLIEADPALAAACRVARPGNAVVQCALGPPERAGEVLELRCAGLMSHVRGALGTEAEEARRAASGLALQGLPVEDRLITVPVRTLTDVLAEARAPAEFDLLSLDVEGYEAEVLRGLDLAVFRPRALCIEVRKAHEDAIRRLLEPRYRLQEVLHKAPEHADQLWLRAEP